MGSARGVQSGRLPVSVLCDAIRLSLVMVDAHLSADRSSGAP